mmetsp:Transcript_21498/g.44841  ORF Transcript_21498/g.44841 Transcript_21498/m.44841 type:complete len:422 (-) Transcript_21498:99-1364(-)|eukprot:CAMPEP_0172439806 /NCGR_PEP_ID=MMETSP1065-20121228/672_1 /TAXON_ID=265537 /ORGANISM="Amphiprora paludosa, Strain CCMP125" /LENGTH=421 /DNA_ID=CAMNT_0013188541 /DNA_START=132 /DNA_END=1397 /DNA_ORIENTATION=+
MVLRRASFLIAGFVLPSLVQMLLEPGLIQALFYKFGGAVFWTGYNYKLLQNRFAQKLIQQNPVVEATFYSECEDWEKCAPLYQKHVVEKFDLKASLPSETDFGHFLRAVECMSMSGDFDDSVTQALVDIKPASPNQEATILWQRHIWRRNLEIKDQRKESIQLAEDFLKDQKFADGVENPLIYVRYGRISLLAFMIVFVASTGKRSTYAQFGRICFGFLFNIAMVQTLPDVGLFLLDVCLGQDLGWKQCLLFCTLNQSIRYNSHLHSESLLSRVAHFEAVVSSSEAERARQIFIKYPYHVSDIADFTVLFLLTSTMQGFKMNSCLLNPARNFRDCQYIDNAARTVVSMYELDEAASDDEAQTLAARIETVLDVARFPSIDDHSMDVARRNRVRVDVGQSGTIPSTNSSAAPTEPVQLYEEL